MLCGVTVKGLRQCSCVRLQHNGTVSVFKWDVSISYLKHSYILIAKGTLEPSCCILLDIYSVEDVYLNVANCRIGIFVIEFFFPVPSFSPEPKHRVMFRPYPGIP